MPPTRCGASRWQVELFFKWIKQHLRIKRFYGTSENALLAALPKRWIDDGRSIEAASSRPVRKIVLRDA